MNLHQLKQALQNNLFHGEQRRNYGMHFVGVPFDIKLALTSFVLPDSSRVWGVDISHWNIPPVDLKRMVDLYGLDFVIIKGCDGSLNTKYYPEHIAAAKYAGVPWGMYVWLYPANKVNMDAQVNAWYTRYASDIPQLGVFIDAEWTTYGGVSANPNATDLRSAHDKWRVKSGKAATTYTAPGYADTYLKGFDWTREDLWCAHFGVPVPTLPFGASKYVIHQFTSNLDGKALDPNGNAELDGNYYNGTLEQFRARYGIDTPTNGGTTMSGYYKVKIGSLNIRDNANNDYYNFNAVKDDIIHSVEVKLDGGITRHRMDAIYRGGVLVWMATIGEWWIAEKSTANVWMVATDFTPPASGGTPAPLPATITTIAKDDAGNVLATYVGTKQ